MNWDLSLDCVIKKGEYRATKNRRTAIFCCTIIYSLKLTRSSNPGIRAYRFGFNVLCLNVVKKRIGGTQINESSFAK